MVYEGLASSQNIHMYAAENCLANGTSWLPHEKETSRINLGNHLPS